MSKVILVIRDGWGYRVEHDHNALFEAGTPHTDALMQNYPNTLLQASGEAVGLPDGFQGNSEVGHTTIGGGRIIYQPMVRINKDIETGDFYRNPAFLDVIQAVKDNGSKLHLMGLLQSEGVHALETHLYALLELCRQQGLHDQVLVHIFTDGRDAPVNDGLKHLAALQVKMTELNVGRIVSLSGRYYAMDRDKRWDRTRSTYNAIVKAEGASTFTDPAVALKACYAAGQTDEFVVPQVHQDYRGMNAGDGIIFFNFRTDRTRQLTKAIVEPEFEGWERAPQQVRFVAMTQYYEPMHADVAFRSTPLTHFLGEVVGTQGLKQLRISETEKYAHVTFFFNGQVEAPAPGEERILINSPKVATYDLQPQMSAREITERLSAEIAKDVYDLIVVNLVNGDMVGHTGITEACVEAVRTVDECVAQLVTVGLEKDYTLLIFADHGNIEDQSDLWRTSHTTNPVPLIVVSNDERIKNATLQQGCGLQDIAPTVLQLLGIPKPVEMTGESILNDR